MPGPRTATLHSLIAWAGPTRETVEARLAAGANINEVDRAQRTVLHYAVRSFTPDIVALLLRRGAAESAPDEAGMTPLHFAVSACSLDAIELLVHHGADVNAADQWGHTPLSQAQQGLTARTHDPRLLAIVESLLRHGAVSAPASGTSSPPVKPRKAARKKATRRRK